MNTRHIRIICFLMLITGWISCGENKNHKEADALRAKENRIKDTITLEAFKNNGDIPLEEIEPGIRYGATAVTDTFLLCATLKDTLALHIYSTNTGKKLGAIIKVGAEKGECLNVYSIFRSQQEKQPICWIYDINLKKMIRIDIAKALHGTDPFILEEIILQGDMRNFNSPVMINDSLIAACSYLLKDCRYFYFDYHKDNITKVGHLPPPQNEWPEDNNKGQFNVIARTFNGKMVKHPEKQQFAIAYKTTDRIDIYDHDSLVRIIRGPALFDPIKQFTKEQDIIMSREYKKTKFAFIDVTADKDHIYVIYSGKDNFMATGKHILVYDWKGDPQTKYQLNIPIGNWAFTTKGDSTVLYAISGETLSLVKGAFINNNPSTGNIGMTTK